MFLRKWILTKTQRSSSLPQLQKSDTSKIHLYEKIDSMWYRAKYKFGAEPGKPRSLKLVSTWDPGHEYSVEVDSAAFTDIYGKVSAKYKQGVRIPSMDEYGTLIMTLQNMEGKNCLLQLLNESDKPVKERTLRTTKQPSITSNRATTITPYR